MNGIHDLGGLHGFGPVDVRRDEPRFHADWERRVFGMNMATLAQGVYNVDENRYARERIQPVAYLASSYWEQLLAALETCLVDKGVVSLDEIDARAQALAGTGTGTAPAPVPTPETEAKVAERMAAGLSRQRQISRSPRFAVGDWVVTRLEGSVGHTRLPAYARGRCGTVTLVGGAYVLPDTNAHGEGERPEHLYQVSFAGSDLWGRGASPGSAVVIDLWESYLDRP